MEERLQSWGTTEAALVDHPPAFVRTPQRRWPPVVAAAAAVLLIAGGAAAFFGSSDDRAVRPVATPTLPPVDVPWTALAAGPMISESPLPKVTPDTSIRHCAGSDLSASDSGEGDGASGHILRFWTLTNTSESPCLLTGSIEAVSGVFDGARRDIPLHAQGFFPNYPDPIVLASGQQGLAPFSFYPRCDDAPASGPTAYSAVKLTLLGATLDVSGKDTIDLGCHVDEGIAAGPVGGPEAPTRYSVLPLEHLDAAITVAGPLRAGEPNDFVVTLTNPTESTIGFDTCPSYMVWTDETKLQYRLNCGQARPIPAGGSETFGMRITVSASAATGAGQLGWEMLLNARRDVDAHVPVTITGGQDPFVGHEACTPASTVVPCTSGLKYNEDYPYLLHTKCGLVSLYAEGHYWAPSGGPLADLPDGYDAPDDPGFVRVVKPDVLLEYRSRQYARSTWVQSDPPTTPCD